MRTLTDHKVNEANKELEVLILDEPGQGGASHRYQIKGKNVDCKINFQNGPIKVFGVNGVTQEALLAIVCDRLKSFQVGEYSCRENAVALTHLETAQLWLYKRTLNRLERGVEGTNVK